MLLIEKTSIAVPKIIENCKKWAYEYVLELSLCPFARQPLETDEIGWVVEDDPLKLVALIEGFLLGQWKSLFIILPKLSDFESYLDLIGFCEELIEQIGESEEIKVVTFHPEHQYEGTDVDEELNFANRSPYPMLQLLRNEDLNEIGMTDEWKNEILDRNEAVLKQVGAKKLKEMLDGFKQ